MTITYRIFWYLDIFGLGYYRSKSEICLLRIFLIRDNFSQDIMDLDIIVRIFLPCIIIHIQVYLGRKNVIYFTIIYARPSLLHFYFCPWETFNPMHHSRMNIGKCHAEYSVEKQGLKKCSIRLPDCQAQIYTAVT